MIAPIVLILSMLFSHLWGDLAMTLVFVERIGRFGDALELWLALKVQ